MLGDTNPILTIGHSNHPIELCLGLLQSHLVQTVIDVRTSPNSRFVPRFNRGNLSRTLADNNINYVFAGQMLGGRPHLPELYTPQGMADYRAMATTMPFTKGIDLVVAESLRSVIALMCSEKEPADCHHTLLIGHQLHHRGHDVRHIVMELDNSNYRPRFYEDESLLTKAAS